MPLLGGGVCVIGGGGGGGGRALSRIQSVAFRLLTTRCHLLFTLTLTQHILLHVTPDYSSHDSFALIARTQLKALITHTQLNPFRHSL